MIPFPNTLAISTLGNPLATSTPICDAHSQQVSGRCTMRLEFLVSARILGIAGTATCLGIPVFAGLLLVGQPQGSESCKFSVLGELTKTAVTGPEDVVRLVRVIEQPDSPVEVVAIDFEGTWVAVHNERYSYGERCKYRIRNRSSRL